MAESPCAEPASSGIESLGSNWACMQTKWWIVDSGQNEQEDSGGQYSQGFHTCVLNPCTDKE